MRTAPRVRQVTRVQGTCTNKHKQNQAVTPPRVVRQTRSRAAKTYDIGTIIRKRFSNRKYYEGEVTDYDPINQLYQIQYLDGDAEEFTPAEMKQYYYQPQRYSQKTEVNAAGGTLWDPELNKNVPLQRPHQTLQPSNQTPMEKIQ